MSKYYFIENIESKCQVCGNKVMIDQFGHGLCENCGWKQGLEFLDFPDKAMCPNLISLNKAKYNYLNGRPLILLDFDDFIKLLNFYGELEFKYNNIRYGVFWATYNKEKMIEFFLIDGDMMQRFPSSDLFAKKANIEGVLLKNLWNEVVDAGYIQ